MLAYAHRKCTHIMIFIANVNDTVMQIWCRTTGQQQCNNIQRTFFTCAHQIRSFRAVQVCYNSEKYSLMNEFDCTFIDLWKYFEGVRVSTAL